jgi:hypothetical protein
MNNTILISAQEYFESLGVQCSFVNLNTLRVNKKSMADVAKEYLDLDSGSVLFFLKEIKKDVNAKIFCANEDFEWCYLETF